MNHAVQINTERGQSSVILVVNTAVRILPSRI